MKNSSRYGLLAVVLAISWATPAYALDNVTPPAAYELATTNPDVYILDVRTAEEWKWVGHPGRNKLGEGFLLDGKVFQVSWMKLHKGRMIENPSFLGDVDEIFGRDPNVTLILMCRSGVRGVWSAPVLEAAGYSVLNMVPGFEGQTDELGYRTVNGWKLDKLDGRHLPYSFSGDGYRD